MAVEVRPENLTVSSRSEGATHKPGASVRRAMAHWRGPYLRALPLGFTLGRAQKMVDLVEGTRWRGASSAEWARAGWSFEEARPVSILIRGPCALPEAL